MTREPRALLRAMFDAAVDAALPERCVPRHLPSPPRGRTVVIGAGKASAAMARAVEDRWTGPLDGLVVTRYGHGVPCKRVEIVEAAHPVPDAAGMRAAERMLALVRGLSADDLVLFLVSGGGSSLLTLPAPGLAIEDLRAVTAALLRSGAPIGEMNAVRKHLSAIAGGRLALAAAPARLVALAISDVAGDDPSAIASGPTVGDPTTLADARRILNHYAIAVPLPVAAHLARADSETPKPGDPRLAHASFEIVASARASLDAAVALARADGYATLDLGDAVEGESRVVAAAQAQLVSELASGRGAVAPPAAIVSGGETTVTVRGKGRGGRNAEFLLALGLALDGRPGIHALAADTDGIDGSEDNAGALLAPDSLARARQAGLDPTALLADNDAYRFFAALDDLVVTGPTRTNVNDFRAVLVGAR